MFNSRIYYAIQMRILRFNFVGQLYFVINKQLKELICDIYKILNFNALKAREKQTNQPVLCKVEK